MTNGQEGQVFFQNLVEYDACWLMEYCQGSHASRLCLFVWWSLCRIRFPQLSHAQCISIGPEWAAAGSISKPKSYPHKAETVIYLIRHALVAPVLFASRT